MSKPPKLSLAAIVASATPAKSSRRASPKAKAAARTAEGGADIVRLDPCPRTCPGTCPSTCLQTRPRAAPPPP